jgi:hypothetical protein
MGGKTQRQISIPILPKAQEIIENSNDINLVFPYKQPEFNSFKRDRDITGIEKQLTHHIATKAFASTVSIV